MPVSSSSWQVLILFTALEAVSIKLRPLKLYSVFLET